MVKKVGKTTINQNKNQTKKKEKNLKSFFLKVLQSRSITSLHFFLSLSLHEMPRIIIFSLSSSNPIKNFKNSTCNHAKESEK